MYNSQTKTADITDEPVECKVQADSNSIPQLTYQDQTHIPKPSSKLSSSNIPKPSSISQANFNINEVKESSIEKILELQISKIITNFLKVTIDEIMYGSLESR